MNPFTVAEVLADIAGKAKAQGMADDVWRSIEPMIIHKGNQWVKAAQDFDPTRYMSRVTPPTIPPFARAGGPGIAHGPIPSRSANLPPLGPRIADTPPLGPDIKPPTGSFGGGGRGGRGGPGTGSDGFDDFFGSQHGSVRDDPWLSMLRRPKPVKPKASADDAEKARRSFPLKKMGLLGFGGLLGVGAIRAANNGPEVPAGEEAFDPSMYADDMGAGSSSSAYGASGDEYDKVQGDLRKYYNDLLGQSAQDTQRREQMVNQLYGEQKAYNNELISGMQGENQLRDAELKQFHQDMQDDYQAMGSGGQGFSMAGTEGDRARISDEALADAGADEAYFKQMGGSFDDLMRAGAQAGATQQGEMIRDVQRQGAEDQRSLRNTAMEALLNSQLDRVGRMDELRAQQQVQLDAGERAKTFILPADRPAVLAEVQKFFGEGVEIASLPKKWQQAMQYFMQTGNANVLNDLISEAQSTSADSMGG